MKMNGTVSNDGGGKGLNLHKMQRFEDEKEADYDDHNRRAVDFTSPEKIKKNSKFNVIEEEKADAGEGHKRNSSF
jgi:hypothetical protein